jgi:uncharacterized MAPEG superfamily protein
MDIPLLCVPIALILVYVPKIPLSKAMAEQPGGYDNVNPREQQSKLTGWAARANAAHSNGFESFAPFAIGVIMAHITNAKHDTAAMLSVAYIVSRALYIFLYISGAGTIRSIVWGVGLISSFGLFGIALLQ